MLTAYTFLLIHNHFAGSLQSIEQMLDFDKIPSAYIWVSSYLSLKGLGNWLCALSLDLYYLQSHGNSLPLMVSHPCESSVAQSELAARVKFGKRSVYPTTARHAQLLSSTFSYGLDWSQKHLQHLIWGHYFYCGLPLFQRSFGQQGSYTTIHQESKSFV